MNNKFDMAEPITLKIELSYTFIPYDSLPEDFTGTREDAIEWFKQDLTECPENYINPRDLYDHITEVKGEHNDH